MGKPYERHIVPVFYAVENNITEGEDEQVNIILFTLFILYIFIHAHLYQHVFLIIIIIFNKLMY